MDTTTLLRLLQQDPAANTAYELLGQAGGTVYIVGGAVRDLALNKEPKDIDLMVTGLDGQQIEQALRNHGRLDFTGKAFGVYRFKNNGQEVEIAMPRVEFGNTMSDFRIDKSITIEEDLGRRDFTANAMAVNLSNGMLVDPYKGLQDVTEGTLRTVSPTSFTDDPTRLLRAMTAVAKHQLKPDAETLDAMRKNAHKIASQPPERLQMELDKLLSGADPAMALQIAHDIGMLKYLLPEVASAMGFDQMNPHHDLDVGAHLLQVLKSMSSISGDIDLRLAALLHDIGKPDSFWQDEEAPEGGGGHFYKKIDKDEGGNHISEKGENHEELGAQMAEAVMGQNRLRYPNNRKDRVVKLIQNHMFPYFDSPRGARKFLALVDGDVQTAFDLLKLREADAQGKSTGKISEFDEASLATARELLQQVLEEESAVTVNDLAIDGNDLIEMGMKAGPELGTIKKKLLDVVIENPELNNREDLLRLAQGFLGLRQSADEFSDEVYNLVNYGDPKGEQSYADQLAESGPMPPSTVPDQEQEENWREQIALSPEEQAKAIADLEAELPEYKWSYDNGVLDVWPTKTWDAPDHAERTGPAFRSFAQGRFYMDPDGYTELFVWVNRGTERERAAAVEAAEEWLLENYGWSSDIVTYESEGKWAEGPQVDPDSFLVQPNDYDFDEMYEGNPPKSLWDYTEEEWAKYEDD